LFSLGSGLGATFVAFDLNFRGFIVAVTAEGTPITTASANKLIRIIGKADLTFIRFTSLQQNGF
jgi:hypothetical protein